MRREAKHWPLLLRIRSLSSLSLPLPPPPTWPTSISDNKGFRRWVLTSIYLIRGAHCLGECIQIDYEEKGEMICKLEEEFFCEYFQRVRGGSMWARA
jgi:hypothetical protein